MIKSLKHAIFLSIFALALCGCTAAKLEARLEADPQCKPVINPKTGSLMPCPGTEKGFYASVGLAPAKGEIKPNPVEDSKTLIVGTQKMAAPVNSGAISSALPQNQSSSGCKPQLHKKTGTVLPCPAD